MPDQIVLVAGTDYPRYRADGANGTLRLAALEPGWWRPLCERLARERLASDPSVRVVLFDFFRGTVEEASAAADGVRFDVTERRHRDPADYRRLDHASRSPRLVPPEPRIGRDGGDQVRFFPGISRLSAGDVAWDAYLAEREALELDDVSIMDVYAAIERAAADGIRTRELHFFSHADLRGPILVNSLDLMPPDDPRRDRFDRDGRTDKDFAPPNRDAGAFAQAFRPTSVVYVWGCGRQDVVTHVLRATAAQRTGSRLPRQVRVTCAEDSSLTPYELGRAFGGRWRDGQTRTIGVATLRDWLRRHVESSYPYRIAVVTGARCIGPLPGTLPAFDPGAPEPRFLYVPAVPTAEGRAGFGDVLGVYRDLLGIDFYRPDGVGDGAFGRGFAVFQGAGATS